MEKQAYALVKSLKHFRTYIGYSKVVGYVPHSAVKDILSQQDCLGIRGKWVSKIQKYDLEIKPTKLIKGKGLAKMMTKGNEQALGMVCQNNSPTSSISIRIQHLQQQQWYADIIFYLLNFVDVYVTSECIQLYFLCIVTGCLFWDVFLMYLSHVMPRCSDRKFL